MAKCSVFFEVRAEFLNNVSAEFGFKGLIYFTFICFFAPFLSLFLPCNIFVLILIFPSSILDSFLILFSIHSILFISYPFFPFS
jgi:ABC-type antimicrobial peptide transport system permease subunit